MAAYKEPDLNERRNSAAAAREKALAKLRAKTPVDPAVQAERIAAAEARAQVQAEKRATLKEKKAREQAEKAARVQANPPPPSGPSEAERKAARDAKYAARKARK